ncbi:MAG: DUF1805 domain-containing protein [Candidatus Diapherotrites archaeon]|nr:DUF1805 domain-containing protein [Candidatus Diapherotrites archaeon]
MIETEIVETGRGAALGIKIKLGLPLLIIKAERGYLACGYLNPETIEKIGDCAAIISGVEDFYDMLEKPVKWASTTAKKLGIKEGMKGEDALNILIGD